jgi:flagellar protein FlaG
MVELSMAEVQSAAPRAAEVSAKPAQAAAKQAAEAASKAVKERSVESERAVKEAQKAVQEKTSDIAERQKDALKEAFSGLDNIMNRFDKAISFAVYEESGELYAQVINNQTKEVMKTFPSEEMLDVMARINNSIGMLIDQQG